MPRSNSYDGVPYSNSPTKSTLSYKSRSQSRRGSKRRSVRLTRPPKIRRSSPQLLLGLKDLSPSRSAKRAATMLKNINYDCASNPSPLKSRQGSVLADFSSNSQRIKEKSVSPGVLMSRKASMKRSRSRSRSPPRKVEG